MPAPRFCGLALLLGCCLTATSFPVRAAEPAEADVPLEKVVLFTSGVGFFQHAGTVSGDAAIDMSFKADVVNDLLKSMVVEDLDGGTISAVSYASRDPITKTLETFAINLTTNPSVGQLLGQLRGARIEVEAAAPASGTIVGVEKRPVPAEEGPAVEKDFLTLLTPEGLQTLPLDAITRIRLLDQRLQAEFEQALAVLALGHDNEKKSVSLACRGEGDRRIRVGYVQEAPVWKTSYRFVLADEMPAIGRGKALLQGWAIVENTTDRDWTDVRMALVSGRPISFVMNLYQPLFLARPVVQPELFGSLAPQVYRQDMADREWALKSRTAAPSSSARGRGTQLPASVPLEARDGSELGVDQMYFGRSIASVATGESLGKLFRYEIATPVSIPRQRSAMLPIVSATVEAETIAIYNEAVLSKHPLAGVRLINSTSLDLMQGPVTVFVGGSYAGDAQIEDLPAGGERLLSYAVDLDVEVATQAESRPEEILAVKLVNGTLEIVRRLARTKTFELKNSGADAETVLIEHPLDPDWKLTAPEKPAAQTSDRYRFAVVTEPGTPATVTVAEERLVSQVSAVTSLEDDAILFFSAARTTSPRVKAALADVVERKQAIVAIAAEGSRREEEIRVVEEEQNRIRQNMAQLDRQSDLYGRYVRKFASQEDAVEALRAEMKRLRDREQEARQALGELLARLNLE